MIRHGMTKNQIITHFLNELSGECYEIEKEILELIDAKKVASGFLMAYGPTWSFYYKHLMQVSSYSINTRRQVKLDDLQVTLKLLKDIMEEAKRRIAVAKGEAE